MMETMMATILKEKKELEEEVDRVKKEKEDTTRRVR